MEAATVAPRSRLAVVLRRVAAFVLLVLVTGGLAGVAYAVHDAINRYHDGVALKGLNGKPRPIEISVDTTDLVIPANLIRFPADRRGGLVTAVDLLLLWPSLDGFSEALARDFRDTSPTAPLIYVTITEAEATVDPAARLDRIYGRHFTGPPVRGPGHLVGRRMADDSPYRGEIVYFQPQAEQPYIVRCLAEETEDIPATCLREVNVGHGLTVVYRFHRTRLGDWSSMDDRLVRLVAEFVRRS